MLEKLAQVDRGRLFLPILTLMRDNQRIVLIGMTHFAHEYFFTTVLARLRLYERAGFRVLHENGLILSQPVTSQDHDLQQQLHLALMALKKRLRPLALAYQPDAIVPHPTWISADFGPHEWARYGVDVQASVQASLRIMSLIAHDPLAAIRTVIAFGNNPSQLKKFAPAIIGHRDDFAVAKLFEYVARSPVVTYWGAGHVPGISARLNEAGFVHKQTEWIPAVDLYKFKGLT